MDFKEPRQGPTYIIVKNIKHAYEKSVEGIPKGKKVIEAAEGARFLVSRTLSSKRNYYFVFNPHLQGKAVRKWINN